MFCCDDSRRARLICMVLVTVLFVGMGWTMPGPPIQKPKALSHPHIGTGDVPPAVKDGKP